MTILNALYRDLGSHNVNISAMEKYYRGERLSLNTFDKLITGLQKYKQQIGGYNPSLDQLIKNMENERVFLPKPSKINRESILKSKSRLRRRFPEGTTIQFSSKNIPGHIANMRRRVPFSAENLRHQKTRLRKTASPPKKPRSLAATALFQAMKIGGDIGDLNILPQRLVTSALKGKGRVTPANIRVSKTNLKMVREFKNYVDLVKRAREFARNRQQDPIDNVIHQTFQTQLNSYRLKFKLRGAKNAQMLFNTILVVTRNSNLPPRYRTPFYTTLRAEYKKYGFFKASTIAKVLRTLKKVAARS